MDSLHGGLTQLIGPAPVTAIIKEGWLRKSDPYGANWKLRWCVLMPTSFYYYDHSDKRDANLKGAFELRTARLEHGFRSSKKTPTPFGFAIALSSRSYHFCANSEYEMQEWAAAVGRVLDALQGRALAPLPLLPEPTAPQQFQQPQQQQQPFAKNRPLRQVAVQQQLQRAQYGGSSGFSDGGESDGPPAMHSGYNIGQSSSSGTSSNARIGGGSSRGAYGAQQLQQLQQQQFEAEDQSHQQQQQQEGEEDGSASTAPREGSGEALTSQQRQQEQNRGEEQTQQSAALAAPMQVAGQASVAAAVPTPVAAAGAAEGGSVTFYVIIGGEASDDSNAAEAESAHSGRPRDLGPEQRFTMVVSRGRLATLTMAKIKKHVVKVLKGAGGLRRNADGGVVAPPGGGHLEAHHIVLTVEGDDTELGDEWSGEEMMISDGTQLRARVDLNAVAPPKPAASAAAAAAAAAATTGTPDKAAAAADGAVVAARSRPTSPPAAAVATSAAADVDGAPGANDAASMRSGSVSRPISARSAAVEPSVAVAPSSGGNGVVPIAAPEGGASRQQAPQPHPAQQQQQQQPLLISEKLDHKMRLRKLFTLVQQEAALQPGGSSGGGADVTPDVNAPVDRAELAAALSADPVFSAYPEYEALMTSLLSGGGSGGGHNGISVSTFTPSAGSAASSTSLLPPSARSIAVSSSSSGGDPALIGYAEVADLLRAAQTAIDGPKRDAELSSAAGFALPLPLTPAPAASSSSAAAPEAAASAAPSGSSGSDTISQVGSSQSAASSSAPNGHQLPQSSFSSSSSSAQPATAAPTSSGNNNNAYGLPSRVQIVAVELPDGSPAELPVPLTSDASDVTTAFLASHGLDTVGEMAAELRSAVMSAQLGGYAAALSEADARVDAAETSVRALSAKVTQLEAVLAVSQKAVEEASSGGRLSIAQSEARAARDRAAAAEAALASKDANLQRALAEVQRLTSELAGKEAELSDARRAAADLRRQLEAVTAEAREKERRARAWDAALGLNSSSAGSSGYNGVLASTQAPSLASAPPAGGSGPDYRAWAEEKRALLENFNVERARNMAELKRLRAALNPSAAESEQRLRLVDDEVGRLQSALTSAELARQKSEEELKHVYAAWQEDGRRHGASLAHMREQLSQAERENITLRSAAIGAGAAALRSGPESLGISSAAATSTIKAGGLPGVGSALGTPVGPSAGSSGSSILGSSSSSSSQRLSMHLGATGLSRGLITPGASGRFSALHQYGGGGMGRTLEL